MNKWLCGPIITDRKVGTDEFLDDVPMFVYIDTDDVQHTLYDAFNNSGWENGRKYYLKNNYTKEDNFSIIENDEYFDVYINDKHVAFFGKIRECPYFDVYRKER